MVTLLQNEALAAALEHVGEGLLDGMERLPPGVRAQLARIGNQERLIDGAHSRWVDSDFDRSVRQAGELAQGVGELGSATGPEIIDFAWFSVLGKEVIAADHLANIFEVTNDLQIANFDISFAPSFNLSNLVCKGC